MIRFEFFRVFEGKELSIPLSFFTGLSLIVFCCPSLAKSDDGINTEVLTLSSSSRPSLLSTQNSWEVLAGVQETYYEISSQKDSLAAFFLKAKGTSKVSQHLRLDADISGVFEQKGTDQGLKNPSTRRNSGFYLNQVRWNYEVTEWLSLDAGVLNQRRFMSPLLAYNSSYPALRQNIEFKNNSWTWAFVSQQALPTSQKLSLKTAQKEEPPMYLAAAVSVQKTWPFGTQTRFIPGMYQFNNLPSAVAYESCLRGNSSIGECLPNSRFAYHFLGTDTYADITLNLPHEWVITLGGNYMQNFDAPKGQSQGILYELNFFKGLNTDLAMGWGFQYFEKQSDVTPAFYAPFMYENNRKGYGGNFLFTFSRRQMQLKGTFLQTTPLKSTEAHRSTINYVQLSLETRYAQSDD